MKKSMKWIAVALAGLALTLASCDGSLHNTPAAYVTFELTNWPTSGDYDVRGAFGIDAWNDQVKRKFTVTNGAGKYEEESIIFAGRLNFTIVTAVAGSWTRDWRGASLTEGNELDFGNYDNFVVNVPMDGGTHHIKLDGSTNPATIYLDDVEQDNTQADVFN